MKKYIIIIILFSITFTLTTINTFAQNSLSGKITNNIDNSALPGATIYIPDVKIGAVSNDDGTYKIENIPNGTYVVEVSFIGFATQSKTINTNGSATADFAMDESAYPTREFCVTGTCTAQERKHNPQSTAEVTSEYLNENSSTNVIDAIANTPGVAGIGNGQSITKPAIRGLGYNRVLTINDGVEQMDQPWFDEFGIECDADAVDRYEILKGPGSLAYGSDAIAGVINLIPGQALPEGERKGEVLLNYQTNNGLINNMVHLAGTQNGIAWSMRVDNTMAHAYQNPNDGYVLNSQFSNFNVDGTIGIHKSWGYTQFHAGYFEMKTGIIDGTRDSAGHMLQIVSYPDINPAPGDSTSAPGAPFYEQPTKQQLSSYTPLVINQRIQHYKLVWDNSLSVGDGRINAIFSYQKNQRQEFNDPTIPDVSDIYYYSNAVTYDLRYISPKMGGFDYSVGLNGAYQKSQSLGTVMLIPDYDFTQVGFFVIANEKVNEHLYLSGGVRYDTRTFNGIDHWVDSTTQAPIDPNGPNGFHEFQGFTSKFSGVSGSIGATYDFTKNVYAKLNIARGWRAPNVAECGANGVHDGTPVYELGDNTLTPETSLEEDFTFGINSKDVSFEATGFMNTINDFIFAESLQSVFGGDSINNSLNAVGLGSAPVYKYSSGKAILKGGEAGLDIHPSAMPWIELNTTFSMVDGSLSGAPDSVKYLPFIPPMKITADIKFHIKKICNVVKNAYIKFGIMNVSQQNHIYTQSAVYDGLDPNATPYEYAASQAASKGYTLLSAGLGGQIMSKGHRIFDFYVMINNLGDTPYMDYMSRFKYLPVNLATNNVGVFNMGRNISFKVIIPFDMASK